VAHLVELCTLVYPHAYGASLADDLERWGKWLLEQAKAELADFYPTTPASDQGTFDGVGRLRTPVAYLWTRTVPCPNPTLDPHELHLVRQTWLRKKAGRYAALRPVVDRRQLQVGYEVVEADTPDGLGFDPEAGSSRGSATCRICGASVSADAVKVLGRAGKLGRRLMGVAFLQGGRRGGKTYVGSVEGAGFVPADEWVNQQLASIIAETGLTVPETPLPDKD
jgi:putative DNA methylase